MGELAGELVRLGFLLTLWAFGIWVGGASVAAWVAWEKGREPVAWFVLAFFLSPLVALVALGAVSARHLGPRRGVAHLEDPVVAAARLVNGVRHHDKRSGEGKRWDVATSAAMSTKRPW